MAEDYIDPEYDDSEAEDKEFDEKPARPTLQELNEAARTSYYLRQLKKAKDEAAAKVAYVKARISEEDFEQWLSTLA